MNHHCQKAALIKTIIVNKFCLYLPNGIAKADKFNAETLSGDFLKISFN